MIKWRLCIGLAVLLVTAGVFAGVGTTPMAAALAPGPFPGAVPFRSDGTLRSAPATVHQPSFGHVAVVVGTDGGLVVVQRPGGVEVFGGSPGGAWWGIRPRRRGPTGVSTCSCAVATTGCGRYGQPVAAVSGRAWLKPVGDEGCWRPPLPLPAGGRAAWTCSCWAPTAGSISGSGTVSSWGRSWVAVGAPPPGASSDRPGAASWGPGRLDVFVRGGTTGCGRGSGPGPAGRAGSSLQAPRQGCWLRPPAPARGVPVCSTVDPA